METLIRPNENEHLESRELQARYDLQTEFAEMVDGSMRTTFELVLKNGDLFAQDGRGLDEVTANAIVDARALVDRDPTMEFVLRRTLIERQEKDELVDMANGFGPNTMIVVSDSPTELSNFSQDVAGYNITRKQTMLRVITRKPDGNLVMISQTLDGSNRVALESIYARFGHKPQPSELLGQRIRVNLSPKEQESATDDAVYAYDQMMVALKGGEWYAGRRPADIRNTFEFVCRQEDIIETFVRYKLNNELTHQLMYNGAATMQKRFKQIQLIASAEKGTITEHQFNALRSLGIFSLQDEMAFAGLEARMMGMTFSACGDTLTSDSLQNELGFEAMGYGVKDKNTDVNSSCDFTSLMCPNCKARNVRTHVTKTRISGSCGCSVKRSALTLA